jgi:very-short-patch-repair endonuclease
MTSLKQLAQYCRDYIDLVSPSLLSRQAKQVVIPQEILDATPLYKRDDEVDYESLVLPLNLEPKLEQLDVEEVSEEEEDQDELSDEEKRKLEIARILDDIYRKYETSSYTKQISLRFGRIGFSAQSLKENADDNSEENGGYKKVEQHLFSVPVSIAYRDTGGARHYTLVIDDTMITTNAGFLNEFLPQEDRDELFKFIAQSEADELTNIPLNPSYVDELWTKITWYLQKAGARDISSVPDMDNVLVILLPKVNYFLSQDLLGIVDAADDEDMLDTSLSAWVDDRDMSVNEPSQDDGGQELFFPFPYDHSQLQVLGKLGNRAAVVEGPPGTGKSQTIANILVHLAATGKKVLFVSQKDQAVRGVKDKLKTLGIPYLYGYLPDRSSRLHSEEDEKDSAANSLKGIAQALYSPTHLSQDPQEVLTKLYIFKPKFDGSIDGERKYFELHSEWVDLESYDFGSNSPRITKEWYDELKQLYLDIEKAQSAVKGLESELHSLTYKKDEQESLVKQSAEKHVTITKKFAESTHFDWVKDERQLLRGLNYIDVVNMMQRLLDSFEAHASDRKSNFIKSRLINMKLSKELNASIEALPREMYESLREIVFSDESKTKRFVELKSIADYYTAKDMLDKRIIDYKQKAREIAQQLSATTKELRETESTLKSQSSRLSKIQLDAIDMQRIEALLAQHGENIFESIARRHQLKVELDNYKTLNPNVVNEAIIRGKKLYKNMVRVYIKNRLDNRVEEFRQIQRHRAALESIGRKLSKSKRAYKTFDSLKSNPENFEAMSGIIPIWMMGLDDASRVLPLAQNIFDYVIIDEASQCNISYALPVMYRSKHTILFGDTLQMRDTTTAFKSNERLEALANKHKIPEDLQIKASEDSVKSVMDIAKLSGFQTTVLRNHYRSPIELIGFSNEYFYAPRGRRLQVVNDDVLATEDGRVLTNHVVAPNPNAELSEKTNVTEAVYIRDILLPKIRSDPRTVDKSIAILTFFNEQAELLRRVITDDSIKIAVIEGIQGDERDIVIYSFVIKSPQDKKRYIALTGESGEILKEVNEGRVNVAFSRARFQVHAVTSIAPNLWPEGIWIKRYLEYVEEHGRVNRLLKSEQHFDSKFEENVYDFLFSKLDPSKYTLTTQVESCGFKIDLVIRNIESGKKLAIECDGPTHFEAGDGQVRVVNDYERQFVLETAGWRFYRIIYSEWLDEEGKQQKELLDYISKYMKQAKPVTEENIVTNEQTYVPVTVDVPKEFVEALKASTTAQPSSRFSRKTSTIDTATPASSSPKQQMLTDLEYVPLEDKPITQVSKADNLADWLLTQSISIRRPGTQNTNKGWEARFRVKNEIEADHVSQTLLQAGITPGKAWSKGSSYVVPVYGVENVAYIEKHSQKSGHNNLSKPRPQSAPITPKLQKEKVTTTFSVGDREVNQSEFAEYLQQHKNGKIQIRYQSMRAGSARYWRDLSLAGFDDTYIQVKVDGREYPIKFRRDRVVEYK